MRHTLSQEVLSQWIQAAPADQCASQLEERIVDVVASLQNPGLRAALLSMSRAAGARQASLVHRVEFVLLRRD